MALERLRLTRLRRLEVAEREPYFGRIDFQEQGSEHVERFYIGKAGVARSTDQQPYVIDCSRLHPGAARTGAPPQR